MKVGDTVIHPKYGKGNVVKIMWDKDQVICFLANENRFFTKTGAEFMVDAASKEKSMGTDFDHTVKEPIKETVITYNCTFCQRAFGSERGRQVHETQCTKNADRKTWPRTCGKVKKKRGAQPGNQHARKYQPVEKVPVTSSTVILKSLPPIPSLFDGLTPAPPLQPSPKSFATNRFYDYLLAGILIIIILCGLVYLAVGIKLLVGL